MSTLREGDIKEVGVLKARNPRLGSTVAFVAPSVCLWPQKMGSRGGLTKQAMLFNKSLLQYLACPLSKSPLRYKIRQLPKPFVQFRVRPIHSLKSSFSFRLLTHALCMQLKTQSKPWLEVWTIFERFEDNFHFLSFRFFFKTVSPMGGWCIVAMANVFSGIVRSRRSLWTTPLV